jgi:hypothetical protein
MRKKYFDIQVKSIRNYSYVFMRKDVFKPRKNLLLALILFDDNKEPTLLLIPSLDWPNKAHPFLVERNYEGKKSEPEWGVNITKSNAEEVKSSYNFNKIVTQIL